jgi:signal transduction histidine kinase
LGLAVVRHLVELHGGSVVVNSAGVGHGATFTVRLPLRPAKDSLLPNASRAGVDWKHNSRS